MIKKSLLNIIKVYQKTISPDHSKLGKYFHPFGYCKFVPTCSEYSYQAIEKHGTIKGSYFSILRIMRCNPWSKGGYDPININK